MEVHKSCAADCCASFSPTGKATLFLIPMAREADGFHYEVVANRW
jgi:hypothetical protein